MLLAICSIFIFGACASKDADKEYNKPATYWYNKLISNVADLKLDEADESYISLESEHRNSPLIPNAMIILANGHVDYGQYDLAIYYLEEYAKRFSASEDIDYIEFLKIRAKFLSFKNHLRDQQLLYDTLNSIDDYALNYPNSPYIYSIKTIQSRLYMAKTSFEYEIAELYNRVDKPEAAEYYKSLSSSHNINPSDVNPAKTPWYKKIFE
ncbi:outer membrane protein assembly factor BamD [Arcobacter sp. FWKO B]|nr:outer membrane protein assembly factor BamD [Arcobacter sp. FWKO B]